MKRKLTVRKTIREIKKAWYDAELGPLLTGHALLNLGWTKASIREWLGEPDWHQPRRRSRCQTLQCSARAAGTGEARAAAASVLRPGFETPG